jgi:4-alpha-glucanotransferase
VRARPALRALADRVGILASYVAADGRERRETSDSTRVALLAAMGLDAGDEAAARRSLAALDERDRARILAPARVSFAGEQARVSLTLPPGCASTLPFDLELREEGGALHERSGRLRVPPSGKARIAELPLLPAGIHRVRLRLGGDAGERGAEQTWIVAPRRCTTPEDRHRERRLVGLWANLYTLRSRRGLGIGDFSDLCALLRFAAEVGAAFVGVNPLCALRNRAEEISPYSPVSRLFWNPLYLDVEAVPELDESRAAARLLESSEARRELEALRRSDRLDYERIAGFHRAVVEALHDSFAQLHGAGGTDRARALAGFEARRGPLLRDFATFLALDDHLAAQGCARDWRRWPERFRDPRSDAVREFREAHARDLAFHVFVQFELDRQLARAAAEGRRVGLEVGLYQDLPVGSSASGFDAWAFPELFVAGATLGCPPDLNIPSGQDWSLPPIDPRRLAADGYRYWTLLLRAAFAHSGLVRLDHAMGLVRQFWIPEGSSPGAGAYVRFPTRELLALLALESRRTGALVVGEDLGTVPRGLPASLARYGILSSRVLLFERDRRGSFRPSRRYSRRALVTANTHDLPTLAAYWGGRDLEIQRELGLIPNDAALARARSGRDRERAALLRRLELEGLVDRKRPPAAYPELAAAIHAFLCRTPAPLVAVALDDLAGETEPVNLPGVPLERYPSWTRRMHAAIEDLRDDPGARAALGGIRERTAPRR